MTLDTTSQTPQPAPSSSNSLRTNAEGVSSDLRSSGSMEASTGRLSAYGAWIKRGVIGLVVLGITVVTVTMMRGEATETNEAQNKRMESNG